VTAAGLFDFQENHSMFFRSLPAALVTAMLLLPGAESKAQNRPLSPTEPIPPNPIQIDGTCLKVGGKPFFLISGEMDYFSVPRKQWKSRMSAMKSAGLNCVCTRMPWRLHEPEEGRFDFGSKKDELRDVEAFFKAAKEKDLYVIVRPGPILDEGLKYRGLPDWLAEKTPDLRARARGGADRGAGSVSILHPLFLEKAERWMAEAGRVITRHTLLQGGPVAFVQLDGPAPGISQDLESADYNPSVLGAGRKEGRFAHFLWTRYQTLEKLNYEYGGQYTSFQQVRPPDPDGGSDEFERRRRRDFEVFLHGNATEYLQTLAKWIRAAGVEVPLACVSGGPGTGGDLSDAADRMGLKSLLPGSDHAALPQVTSAGFGLGTLAGIFTSLEILRLMGPPAVVWEMPVPAGESAAQPEILRTPGLIHAACGLKGLNYAGFVSETLPEILAPESAPAAAGPAVLSVSGSDGPVAAALKDFHGFLNKSAWIAEAERDADCRIAWDFNSSFGAPVWGAKGRAACTADEAAGFLKNGLLPALWRAGLSPAFVRLGTQDWTQDVSTPLVVASSSAMSLADQLRLVDFLKRGGRLLIGPVLPIMDERFNPCAELSDFLRAPACQPLGAGNASFRGDGPETVPVDGLFAAKSLPAGAEAAASAGPAGRTVAWRRKTAGGGEAVVLGCLWTDSGTDADSVRARMTGVLMESLGARPILALSRRGCWAAALRSARRGMLFVYNPSPQAAETDVRYAPDPAAKPAWSGKLRLKPWEMKTIEVRY
jgi:beta-galactosidase